MEILKGHTSEETAYLVEDYPYGFRLRCQIRYWLEANKNGMRFCSQTTDPRRGNVNWNKPKRSTYYGYAVMYLDEVGHVKWTATDSHYDPETIAEWGAKWGVTEDQAFKKLLLRSKGMAFVAKHVTYSIVTPDNPAQDPKEKAEIMGKLYAIGVHRALNEA